MYIVYQLYNSCPQEKLLMHTSSGRCLELARGDVMVVMTQCRPGNPRQTWIWHHSVKKLMKEVLGDEYDVIEGGGKEEEEKKAGDGREDR